MKKKIVAWNKLTEIKYIIYKTYINKEEKKEWGGDTFQFISKINISNLVYLDVLK